MIKRDGVANEGMCGSLSACKANEACVAVYPRAKECYPMFTIDELCQIGNGDDKDCHYNEDQTKRSQSLDGFVWFGEGLLV